MELEFDFGGIDLVYRNTTKGNKCLYVCNYLYYYKRTNANRTSKWVCHEKKCNASVSINKTQNGLVNVNGKQFVNKKQIFTTHLHELVDEDEIIVKRHVEALKKKAESANGKSMETIYFEQQSEIIKEIGSLAIVAQKFPQYA
jgi:hypothetical protein